MTPWIRVAPTLVVRTMREMGWISYYPLRAAAALVVLLGLLGGGVFVLLDGREQRSVGATNAAQTTTEPDPVAEPVVPEFPAFVVDFIERLNQINAYVSLSSNAEKAPMLYKQLWSWARDGGVEVYGLDGGNLDRKLTEPTAHKVLELTTLDGNSFCVVEVSRLDRKVASPPYLYQGLYNGNCAEMSKDPLIG